MGMYSQVGGALTKPGERAKVTKQHRSQPSKPLTRYEALKSEIRTWWNEGFKVGEALREIRDSKLYREEHVTFEEFCQKEYGMSAGYGRRLIEAFSVKESLQNVPIGTKVVHESQARALAVVPEEKREEVLTKAAESGKVTATSITEAAADLQPESKESKREEILKRLTEAFEPAAKPKESVKCPTCEGRGYVD